MLRKLLSLCLAFALIVMFIPGCQEPTTCGPDCKGACCAKAGKGCPADCTKACCAQAGKGCHPGCTKACCAKLAKAGCSPKCDPTKCKGKCKGKQAKKCKGSK